MQPLVSILIPAYNAEKWITETLRSAVAQTWKRKEIIVVDDGSKDQTLVAAKRFEAQGVRIVTQKNQGAATARNNAFRLSQGEYIQWLDADDLISHDKIARQMALVEQIRNPRILLSCGWGRFFFRYNRAEFQPTSLWCDLKPAEWLVRKMSQNLHMQPATWLVSRELTETAGPWDSMLTSDDDGEYFCRVLLQSEGVRFEPEARVYYRASGPSSLSYIGNSDSKREAQWKSMQLHIGYLRSLDDSSRAREACLTYMQNWLTFFYPERPDLIEEMQVLAQELGGHLQMPATSWKYVWIERVGGRNLARRAQLFLPRIRWAAVRFWDRLLFRLQGEDLRTLTAGT